MQKRIVRFIFIIISFISYSKLSNATHLVGSDISLKCLGGLDYEVKLVLYRDCNGVSIGTNQQVKYSSASCGFSGTITISHSGPREITPLCPTEKSTCSGGKFMGIEEYVYIDTLTLPQACPDWVFSWTACCRNNAITNISPTSVSMYNEAVINNFHAPCNSAPFFTNLPVAFVCEGQDFTYNHGALDLDGDSLSYQLIPPKISNTSNVSYVSPYSVGNPLNSSPPFSLDPLTGDVHVLPTNAGEITVVAVKVDQYRNGQFIGSVIRDIQIIVVICGDNDLPWIDGINSTGIFVDTICPNEQYCFFTLGHDPDTLQILEMTWNGGIINGNFVYTDVPISKGTFCWTPTQNDVQTTPHTFTVTIKDDACPFFNLPNQYNFPMYGFQTYSFNLYVRPGHDVDLGPDQYLYCDSSALLSPIITTGSGSYTYEWQDGSTDSSFVVTSPGFYSVGVTDLVSQCTVYDTMEFKNGVQAVFSQANFCSDNQPSIFTDSSFSTVGNITNWDWNFGDGFSSTDTNPTHAYQWGQYTVQLIVSDQNGCADTTSMDTYIDTLPVPDFNIVSGCVADTTFYQDASVAVGDSIVSWQWDFGDTTTLLDVDSIVDPYYVYSFSDTFLINLSVTSATGCSNTITKPFVSGIAPIADFSNTAPCGGDIIVFTDLSVSSPVGGDIITWHWNFGDSMISNLTNPVHTYAQTGNYNVTLTITDSIGCENTFVKPISITPVAGFYQLPDAGCEGVPVAFFDTSFTTPNSTFQWDFGTGDSSLLTNPTYQFDTTGVFPITLTLTDSNGCTDVAHDSVSVFAMPVADFGVLQKCQDVDFSDLTVIADQQHVHHWYWDFGEAGIATDTSLEQAPSYTYVDTGSFLITLIVETDMECVDTITQTINVTASPEARISFDKICFGDTAFFKDSTLIGANAVGMANWAWVFGDGGSSPLQHPQHIYSVPGNYTVSLRVMDSTGCQDTTTVPIRVRRPVVDFSVLPDSGCFPMEVAFQDSSQTTLNANYQWDIAGVGYSAPNPIHTFNAPGNHLVQLTVTDSLGCVDSLQKTVYSFADPTAGFTVADFCVGDAVSFTDTSTFSGGNIIGWDWRFGDGSSSTDQHPTHAYNAAATYPVQLIVTTGIGCVDTVMDNLTVLGLPSADFLAAPTCFEDTVYFMDQSNTSINGTPFNSWSYSLGDGAQINAAGGSHYYANPGNYTVQLIVTDVMGCADTTEQTLRIGKPVPDFTVADDMGCFPSAVSFTDISTATQGATYSWDFGDGLNGTGNNPVHTYQTDSTFTVKLVITDSLGCVDSVEHPVVIYSPPLVDFTTGEYCRFDNVSFQDLSTASGGSISSWDWQFGNGSTSSNQNPNQVYNQSGTFQVTLIVNTTNGCSASATKPVIIHAPPQADFDATEVCVGADVQFTNTTLPSSFQIASWNWGFGDGQNSVDVSPTHPYADTGTYTVSLIATDSLGCKDTIEQDIIVHPFPIADFSVDTTMGCYPLTVLFEDESVVGTGNGFGYSWSFGDGQTGVGQTPAYTYNQPGNYTVSLQVTSPYGCSDSLVSNALIQVVDRATANFSYDPSKPSMDDPIVNFINNSINSTYWIWDFGNGDTIHEENPVYEFPEKGYYTIYLVAAQDADGACSDTISKEIWVAPNQFFKVPTAFTPNGDGVNDVFRVHWVGVVESAELRIYNRWGEMVYMTNDLDQGWDGTFRGKVQDSDTFVYYLTADLGNEREPVFMKGDFSLLR